MLTWPDIDPVAVRLGPVEIHWYGLMYLIGFAIAWTLMRYRIRRPGAAFTARDVDDLLFFGVLGVILGGRIGYVLFYNLDVFLSDPLLLLKVWQGGMSFHGGLLGVLLAGFVWGRRRGKTFFEVMDFVAPFVPPGLGAGRIGNFINGELWGRPGDAPWAMVFPFIDSQPRHPSQLYEALLEGLVLFVVLWFFSAQPRARGRVSGMFLVVYGMGRFTVEFFREPDRHIGYLAFDWFTMGQLLTLPMIAFGLWLLLRPMEGRDA